MYWDSDWKVGEFDVLFVSEFDLSVEVLVLC